jgi:hypothetical protein
MIVMHHRLIRRCTELIKINDDPPRLAHPNIKIFKPA